MIRLTLNPGLRPEIHLYTKTTLTLGSDPLLNDLVDRSSKTQSIHLRFSKNKENWNVVNLTHDPFTTLNGMPFGEKKLSSGDSIQIGSTELLFEILEEEKKISESESLPSSAPFSLKSETKPKERSSLKDDYLKNLEDDQLKDPIQKEPSHLFQAWKSILIFIFLLFAFIALMAGIVSINLAKREKDEIKAIQGMSDIAMALVEGHLSDVKQPHQNWSDPDFLKNRLQQILPTTFSYASEIDAQGQFNCCPYTLRIYTNGDLSKFLLIAQPASPPFYWPITKPILVIDSTLMEIKSLKDVRSLNRLVAHPDPLEGVNGQEITALVKQGSLVKLSFIADLTGKKDFSPPKTNEPAQNLIYNAPRYYHLTLPLLEKIEASFSNKLPFQELKALKKEMARLSSLNNLILYSDQGKEGAEKIKRAIEKVSEGAPFLFGYLVFDQGRDIQGAELFEDESSPPYTIAYQEPLEESKPESTHSKELLKRRQEALLPLTEALIQLLKSEESEPRPSFKADFEQMVEEYLELNAAENERLSNS